jgi:hypothetical protein
MHHDCRVYSEASGARGLGLKPFRHAEFLVTDFRKSARGRRLKGYATAQFMRTELALPINAGV